MIASQSGDGAAFWRILRQSKCRMKDLSKKREKIMIICAEKNEKSD